MCSGGGVGVVSTGVTRKIIGDGGVDGSGDGARVGFDDGRFVGATEGSGDGACVVLADVGPAVVGALVGRGVGTLGVGDAVVGT